jgi:hypothetical protein
MAGMRRGYQTHVDGIFALASGCAPRHSMSPALPLRAALTRGALLALANWPVIVIDFVVESLYKVALGVPVLGGAFMVGVLLGADMQSLLGDGLLTAADRLLVSLGQAPIALAAFVLALALVAGGGQVLMYMVKSGSLAILVDADRRAGEIERSPVRFGFMRAASMFSLGAFVSGMRRFQRRAATLALGLAAVYVFVGAIYVATVTYGFQWAAAAGWEQGWPLLVVVATSAGVVSLTAANLLFDLTRVVMTTDDSSVRAAFARVRQFLLTDARQVLGIFGTMALVLMLATAVSIVATAGLTLVAWVPLVGLIVLPLQLAFWVLRGVFFQYASLATLSACQCQYRRVSQARRPAISLRVHEA